MKIKNTLKILLVFLPFLDFVGETYSFNIYMKIRYYLSNKENIISKLLLCYIRRKLFSRFNCVVSLHAKIGKDVRFVHPVGLVIGSVVIGDSCTIFQNVSIGIKHGKWPTIKNNVVIAANSVIIGDIVIGDNAFIGASSVVIKSVPPYTVVAGNPAKVIKNIKPSISSLETRETKL